jgi:hypothetical protein
MIWVKLAQDWSPVVGFCEYGNERSGLTKADSFLTIRIIINSSRGSFTA